MGKKLDALLGRNFKTSKFKVLVNIGLSRLTVLKNQRQARCSVARSDVVQLLNLGHHERALLRVEQVIKEKNMLDVFAIIEGYCHLVVERVNLIEEERVCPEELKEAIASLLYASTRCGEFPELQEIREVITSRFGKEFTARAIELRNNCGVNPKMIQKLSTRQPSLENRLKVLKEIASENNIVLQIEEEHLSEKTEDKLEMDQKQSQPTPDRSASLNLQILYDERENIDGFTDSTPRRKYRDVADAAQAAFESAAYAAAAARAAVELSQSGPHNPDDHDHRDSYTFRKYISNAREPKLGPVEERDSRGTEDSSVVLKSEKIHSITTYQAELGDDKIHNESKTEEFRKSKNLVELERSASDSSSNSSDNILKGVKTEPLGKVQSEMIFDESDESDDDNGIESSQIPISRTHDMVFDKKPSLFSNEVLYTEKSYTVTDEDLSEDRDEKCYNASHTKFPLRSQAGLKVESGPGKPKTHLKAEERPISVRTRRGHGR